MQFITSLIGGSGNTWLTALFALGIVLVLIVLGVWLLKLVLNASTNASRGRNRRLGVVDSLSLDPKRQLLIIRRDNVEHLILTGGPQDIVIEAGITMDEQTASQPSRRPIPQVAPRKTAPTPAAATQGPATRPPARQAPEPQTPVSAVTPAKPLAEPLGAPGTVLAELEKQGHPANRRAHLSLRHTGLLRPVSEVELPVSPENSASPTKPGSDSATQEHASTDFEGNAVDEGTSKTERS